MNNSDTPFQIINTVVLFESFTVEKCSDTPFQIINTVVLFESLTVEKCIIWRLFGSYQTVWRDIIADIS